MPFLRSVVSLCFLTLLAGPVAARPVLGQADRTEANERVEKLWQLKDTDVIQRGAFALMPVRDYGLQGGSTFRVEADGILISVPARAFATGAELKVRLVHLRKHADFALLDIPMHIRVGNRLALFESAGMFQLEFLDRAGRGVRPALPLTVEMASLNKNLNPAFYRLENGRWQETKPAPVGEEALPAEGCGLECGFDLYGSVDRAGWWNFDVPHTDFTCLKVKLQGGDAQVKAVGLDYYGVSYGQKTAGGSYEINVLRNKKVKVFAERWPQPGQNGLLGALPELLSPDRTAFAGQGRCEWAGNLRLQPVAPQTFQKRETFLEQIGLRDL